jgi:hypothetical protein
MRSKQHRVGGSWLMDDDGRDWRVTNVSQCTRLIASPQVAYGSAEAQDLTGKIAFLCTGQGAQYPDMGRELYEHSPLFRATLDAVRNVGGSRFASAVIVGDVWR